MSEELNDSQIQSHFLANASHAFLTPLHVIQGGTDMLLKKLKVQQDPELKRSLEMIYNSSEFLNDVIVNVIDLAKMDRGEFELRQESFLIRDLLTDLEELFQFISDLHTIRAIELKTEIDPAVSQLCMLSDRKRLTQVIKELLRNAVKFTKKGLISLTITYDQGHLKVTVSDTGIGIDPVDLKMIFEPFYQSDNAVLKNLRGVGLGLAYCKSLISRLNGTIQVESEIGTGTQFHISLPFVPGDVNQNTEYGITKSSKTYASLDQVQVLVCDDDSFNLCYVEMILKDKCPYTLTNSGQQALQAFQEKPYDVVLMDIQMPKMNGKETLKKIREIDKAAQVPIIALSALDIEQASDELFRLGFNNFLSKPFNEDELFEVLQKTLNIG